MPTLINMQMSAEEAKEQTQPSCADEPKYPWGLSLTLDDDALEKLGVTTLPAAGTEIQIAAKATVTSINAYDRQGGDSEQSMCLQITDMAIVNLDALTTEGQLEKLYSKTPGKK